MSRRDAEIDIDSLIQEFNTFCAANLPSDILRRMQDYEGEHLAYVSSQYGRFVSQFEASYDALVRIIDHVNYGAERSKWPGHRVVQFIVAVQNVKPIRSAQDRLLRGYYEDSLTLMRVAYEAFVRIVFISLHPDAPVYSFGERRKGARHFNLTNFVADELRLGWNEYEVLSAMAHSYKLAVLKQLTEIGSEGQREPLTLSFTRDEVHLTVGINILEFLLLVYLRTATTILLHPVKPGALDQKVLSRATKCIELWQKSFVSHPKPYWRTVANDLDYVFELVRAAEDGRDWKRIREELKPRPLGARSSDPAKRDV